MGNVPDPIGILRAFGRAGIAALLFLSVPGIAEGPSQTRSVTADCVRDGLIAQLPGAKKPAEAFLSVPLIGDKAKFFEEIGQAIEKKKSEIRQILSRVDNAGGTELELDIVERQLKGIGDIELYRLEHTPPLNDVAVYASTNVPLYTLVSHGIIPASVSRNVWFRTPEATRSVYADLYRAIASELPPGRLDGLHLLTESRDVQYDNFNKMHVLGMNKHGTRSERPPSQMVIFTGSPETANTLIQRNLEKFRSDGAKFPPFKQIFVEFGAGVNPMVVTRDVLDDLPRALHLVLEPVRINCGQDCMAADFYAVDEKISAPFVESLVEAVRGMKPGTNAESGGVYTPLLMAKKFDGLLEYRGKYEKYLVTPETTIDPESRLVSPHVFVFPYSMFKEVELREHFAPFFTIFTYSNGEELEAMARDPRVQRKAMYATVLGGHKSTDGLNEARNVFMENRHAVLTNETLFGDINANMAFGGRGIDASRVVTINHRAGSQPVVTDGHYPTIFSSEAYLAFGDRKVETPAPLSPPEKYRQDLEWILARAALKPGSGLGAAAQWRPLQEPFLGERPRGLEEIRRVAQKEGLYLVDDSNLTKGERELYGLPIITRKNAGEWSEKHAGQGVVLHLSGVTDDASHFNLARGRINPHLGWGTLHALGDDKRAEYDTAEAIEPGLIPRTDSFEELRTSGILPSGYVERQERVLRNLDELIRARRPLSAIERESLRADLSGLLGSIFSVARKRYPQGAYFKNYGEFGTGDLGVAITTFSTSPKAVASEFLRRFETALDLASKSERSSKSYSDREFQKAMREDMWENGVRFVNRLLTNPDRLLVQGRVNIDRTDMGYPMEFRVDFLDGEPAHGRLRYGHEYYPEEIGKAKQVILDFFKKAPPQFRYLSGGADVARLTDGSYIVMEFNWNGGQSGTMAPGYFPLDYNELVSSIQGRRTQYLQKLEALHARGLGAEREFLKTLGQGRPVFYKASLKQLTALEVGRWFRDRHLEDWARHPSAETAAATMSGIESLFDGISLGERDEVNLLLEEARQYLSRKLRPEAPSSAAGGD